MVKVMDSGFTVRWCLTAVAIVAGANSSADDRPQAQDLFPRRTLTEMLADENSALLEEMSEQRQQHFSNLRRFKAKGLDRLTHFYDFLEHEDTLIAADAHLEFALASDEDFVRFCDQLDHGDVRRKVADEGDSAYRRRLYLAMLAECGEEADGDWIKHQLERADGQPVALEAFLKTYVRLKGEPGLDWLDQRYFGNQDSKLPQTYAAILALRYASDHPELAIPSERIRQSHRLVLHHPLLVDIAISDLSRLQDWQSVDDVVRAVDRADGEIGRWAIIPTINYLRRCPGTKAQQALDKWATQYPREFKRAVTFFPDSVLKADIKTQPAAIRPKGRGSKGC